MRGIALMIALAGVAVACGGTVYDPGSGGSGGSGVKGNGGSGGSGGGGAVGWNDVQPIFQSHCGSCHLFTYDNLHGRSLDCRGVPEYQCSLSMIENGLMPERSGCTGDPARDAGRRACLDAEELDTLRRWVEAGAPR